MLENIYRFLFESLWENGPTGIYMLIAGLGTTLFITFFAILAGTIIGVLVALMRLSSRPFLTIPARVYIEFIRGTPVLVQLMLIFFVVFGNISISRTLAAIIAFGINSGAYTAEIVRAGIQAVDKGQMEAARSVGMSKLMAMRLIILPQAIKNILPALGNELIILLKETSVVGYIGGNDLMRMGDQIRSKTFEATMPLLIVTCIYLIITLSLSYLISRLEKRLRR